MVIKKKKRGLGSGGFSGGGGRQQSPLRPKHVEKQPPCSAGCPNNNRVRKFVTVVAQAERLGKSMDQALEEAWDVLSETTPFPAVCGRVCPNPCEDNCNRAEHDTPININKIERVIGDNALQKGLKYKPFTDQKRTEKIAVVGAGPAGLTCAYHLARRGYPVTVYESADKAGGMLLWGIPRYRLPADILDGEINRILDLGVELKLNAKVGKDIPLDDLRSQYKAVFVSIGAHKGLKLRVEGENADNVISGVEFLNRIHHNEKIDVGSNVIVVGGGDTAIDAARICRRFGADTTILYRRTRNEMPAIKEEIEDALAEGVKLEYLAAPVGFNKEGNRIATMKCIRMELGEPDASGRRRPVPQEGSEFEIPASTVIPAISQAPDFTGFESMIEGRDWFKIDDRGESTKVKGVYAGGDAVNLALAITAIAHGRKAAESIHQSLGGEEPPQQQARPLIKKDRLRLDHFEKKERAEPATLPVEERLAKMDAEVLSSLEQQQLLEESRRCMSCGYCFDCEKCWMFCQDQAIHKPMEKGVLYTFKLENCTGCKKCAEECPCGFIDMQ